MAVAARDDSGRLAIWVGVIGVFSSLSYLGRFSDADMPEEPLYLWSSAILSTVQFLIFLGLVWLIMRGRPLRDALALRRPTSWWVAGRIAVAVLVLVWLMGVLLRPFLDPGEEQNLIPEAWDPSHAAPFAANFAVVALLAPIAEELLFRGAGYTLLERFGRWLAILGTAVAFALAHGLVEGFPVLLVFGAGLAYMRSRVNSVVPGILVHMGFNATVLLLAVRFFSEG